MRVSLQYVAAAIVMNGISSMRRAGLAYQQLIRPRKAGAIRMLNETHS